MDFDPLSLFTPPKGKTNEFSSPEMYNIEGSGLPRLPLTTPVKEKTIPEDLQFEDPETHLEPVHPHDLPHLQLRPPKAVLLTVLKLLSPNDVYNFADDYKSFDGIEAVLADKDVQNTTIEAQKWLATSCPRFDSELKLAHLPLLSMSLKKTHESAYNSWLTSIIASPLNWVDEDDRDDIFKLASLRLSENCGRTAQPEITRKISLPHLSQFVKKGNYILLKEPSLTSDNLGLKTWGSSIILANKLVQNHLFSENKHLLSPVLELGSGTGLVGIVGALLGYQVTLTDLREIVPNLRANLDLNEVLAEAEELDWSAPSLFVEKHGQNGFNTVILSDPIYSSQHPLWVVEMIEMFLSPDPDARVLMQLPIRKNYEREREVLRQLLENKGLVATLSETELGDDEFGQIQYSFKRYRRAFQLHKSY